jgi:hypothetical protein
MSYSSLGRAPIFSPWAGVVCVVSLAVVVSACSLTGSGSGDEVADRTLPEALEAQSVSFEDARRTIPPPDTVNVEAYVVELAICPEDAACFLPDGIVIAESREPEDHEETRRLVVDRPRQFVEGRRYLMSLEIRDPEGRNLDENLLEIIGYSEGE